MSLRTRRLLTVGMVVGLCLPVVFDREWFPLSTYPMYARTRPAEENFVTARGLDGEGRPVVLGLAAIGGSDDPLIVAGELRAAIRAGRAEQRCAEIARRIERSANGRGVVTVEVLTERHDTVEHVRGGDSLRKRTVHATCDIGGSEDVEEASPSAVDGGPMARSST